MDTEYGKTLERKKLSLLFKQSSYFIGISCFIAVLVTFVSWNQADRHIMVGWLTSFLIISGSHYYLVHRFLNESENKDNAANPVWMKDFILCALLTGILWGLLGLFLLVSNPVVHSSLIIIFLGGMVALSIGIFAIVPVIFYVYTIPTLFPAIGWLLFQNNQVIQSIGFFLLTYLVFMSISVLKLNRLIIESLSAELSSRQQLDKLEKEKSDASLLNDTLENELKEIRRSDLQLKREKRKVEELAEKLLAMSTMDGLTGIANRRHFDEFLAREWNRALRASSPLSLILCDIDYFKNYNDYYGHQEGDKCLQRIARLLEEHARR